MAERFRCSTKGKSNVSDRNKEVVRRLFDEVWNAGNLDVAEELIEPGYRSHMGDAFSVRMSRWTGPSIVRVEVEAYRSAFPDLAVAVTELVADGEAVAAFLTFRGTNTGTMRLTPSSGTVDEELEASGNTMEVPGSALFRFANHQIAEAGFGWHPIGLLDQVRLFTKGTAELDLGGGNKAALAVPPP